MSLFILFALSAALHGYIGARLLPALPGWEAAAMALLLVASAASVPLGLLARRAMKSARGDAIAWMGLLFMGLFSSLLVLTFARDLLLLVADVVDLAITAQVPVDAIGRYSAQAIPAFAAALTLIGYANARRTAGVVRVDIPVDGLPAALEGFRIVQISDIHVGPTIRGPYLAAIVDAVNQLRPDVVAITGDLVDGSVAELAAHTEPLRRLASRHGSYFVTGNHEYYSGVEPWVAHLKQMGIRVLHNEHVVISRDDAKLVLAGVTDFGGGHFDESHRSDPHAAMAGAPADAAFKVLLAHQPRSAPAAANAGFDLQLSGHTHGGQFLPWNFLVRLQQPFTAGLHMLGRLRVYVSRGTGYWGPPKRVGAPSEITEIRLLNRSAQLA